MTDTITETQTVSEAARKIVEQLFDYDEQIPASPNAMSWDQACLLQKDYACIIQKGLDSYAEAAVAEAREQALREAWNEVYRIRCETVGRGRLIVLDKMLKAEAAINALLAAVLSLASSLWTAWHGGKKDSDEGWFYIGLSLLFFCAFCCFGLGAVTHAPY